MDTTAFNDLRLWTATMTSLVCSLAAAAYAATGIEPLSFIALLPLGAVILWLQKDWQRTNAGPVLDFGLFMWYAWPILIPWYAIKTRGRRGWRLVVGLAALILAPQVVALVVWLSVHGVSELNL